MTSSQLLTWDGSTLFAGTAGLEKAKKLITDYKMGKIENMTPDLWQAKKIVDSTLHPGRNIDLQVYSTSRR